MRPFLISFAAIISLLFLASCQTLSKEECTAADWRVIGEQDGAAGHSPQDRFAQHAKACEKANVVANQTLWNEGYQRGIIRFCTPLSGLSYGQRGATYTNVCTGLNEAGFRSGYDLGLREHNKQKQLNSIKGKIRAKKTMNESLSDRIKSGKVDQKDAERTIRRNRNDIFDLNRQLGRAEVELSQIQSDVERFKFDQELAAGPIAPVN